ncbi:MAG TPA: hypothetical protein VE974_06080 [Thermoanaerobaculia bacterium]|nr:hypothetical protein [Thermoanaerobaculia bacterium]
MIREAPFGFPRVAGFGDGRRASEYYYSQGMQQSHFGISTGYNISKLVDTGDIATLGNVKWFGDASGRTYAYDSAGNILKEANTGFGDFAISRAVGAGYAGQGLIGDSQGRLLYFGATVVGRLATDGTTYTDAWKTGLTSYAHPADTYEGMTIFGNRDSVGLIDSADNMNLTAFTLPSAMTVDALKAGKNGILIGANLGYRGVLMLWNTQTDRSINDWIWTNGNIQAITPTDEGWIVVTTKEILATNGYSTRKLFSILDDPLGFTNYSVAPQGLVVVNNKLFLLNQSSTTNSFSRVKAGLYIFDLTSELFEFVPMSTMNVRSVVPLAIYTPKATTQLILVGYSDTFLSKNYIGRLRTSGGSSGTFIPQLLASSVTTKQSEAVILSMGVTTVQTFPQVLTFNIAVKVYDYDRQLWGLNLTNDVSAAGDQLRIDGRGNNSTHAQLGDEITILEGLNAGLVAHVTAIANQGLINETWTLDTTFPNNTETGVYLNVQPFKLVGKKAISAATSIPELYFNVKNKYRGKKFLVKVVIDSANAQLELHEGLFVYNDIGITS